MMKNLYDGLRGFIKSDSGVTAIEYGLIAALVSVAVVAGAAIVGITLNCLFAALARCVGGDATCLALLGAC